MYLDLLFFIDFLGTVLLSLFTPLSSTLADVIPVCIVAGKAGLASLLVSTAKLHVLACEPVCLHNVHMEAVTSCLDVGEQK